MSSAPFRGVGRRNVASHHTPATMATMTSNQPRIMITIIPDIPHIISTSTSCGVALLCSRRAARLSTEGFDAFLGDQWNHGEAGERIGPPPSEPRIERQPNEQDRREVCTDRRLTRFGLERAAVELCGDTSLETDQDRHDDERPRGDDDPDAAGGGRLTAHERLGGVDCDI